jgi:hypothetical protein
MRSDNRPLTPVAPPAPAADPERLERLAAAARAGAAEARNDLFAALADPIRRAVARRRGLCTGLTRDDVTSETFLALADLLDEWTGEGFAAAFDRLYGRRLTRRLGRWQAPARAVEPLDPDAASASDAEAALALAIAELPVTLSATGRWLLEQRALGASIAGLARQLGVSPRTVDRRWRALVIRLRSAAPSPTGAPRRAPSTHPPKTLHRKREVAD